MTDHYNELLKLEEFIDSHLDRPRLTSSVSSEFVEATKQWTKIVLLLAKDLPKFAMPVQTIEHGLNLIENPVFIGGTHRSGTTLVASLLDDNSQLVVFPGEMMYFSNIQPKLNNTPVEQQLFTLLHESLLRFINPSGQEPYWILGRSEKLNSPYVEFARFLCTCWEILQERYANEMCRPLKALMLAFICYQGKDRDLSKVDYWVEKSPLNEVQFTNIKMSFPKAKFIQLIRSPYSIYASRKLIEQKLIGKFESKFRCLSEMNASFSCAVANRNMEKDYLVLKYEDLVESPETKVQSVCKFLNIEYEDSMCVQSILGVPAFSNSAYKIDKESNHVKNAVLDRNLSLNEMQRVSYFVGNLSVGFGYDTFHVPYVKKVLIAIEQLLFKVNGIFQRLLSLR
jgi:hypothetical protein